MARHWCNFLTEGAFKAVTSNTQDNTTLAVSFLPIELHADDAFDPKWIAEREVLRTALARNRPDKSVGTTNTLTGSLRTLLYPSQDNLLVAWGFTRVDMGSGGTSDDVPWTTTEPARDLASATFAAMVEDDSLNQEKYRYNGCKCNRMTLAMDAGTMGGAAVLTADWTGSERAASHANDVEPTKTFYPSTAPYHLSDAALTVNGSSISNFKSLSIMVENEVEARIDNRTYAQPIRGWGRTVTIQARQLYKNSPDIQALFLARTSLSSCTVVLTHPTSPTLTFDLKAAAQVTEYQRFRPLGTAHEEQYTITAFYDRSASNDMTVAFA